MDTPESKTKKYPLVQILFAIAIFIVGRVLSSSGGALKLLGDVMVVGGFVYFVIVFISLFKRKK